MAMIKSVGDHSASFTELHLNQVWLGLGVWLESGLVSRLGLGLGFLVWVLVRISSIRLLA